MAGKGRTIYPRITLLGNACLKTTSLVETCHKCSSTQSGELALPANFYITFAFLYLYYKNAIFDGKGLER